MIGPVIICFKIVFVELIDPVRGPGSFAALVADVWHPMLGDSNNDIVEM